MKKKEGLRWQKTCQHLATTIVVLWIALPGPSLSKISISELTIAEVGGVCTGEVKILCRAQLELEEERESVTFTWWHNGVVQENSVLRQHYDEENKLLNDWLHVDCSAESIGNVTCQVTANNVTDEKTTDLIFDVPVRVQFPDSIDGKLYVPKGKSTTLKCKATGRPVPNVTITRGGEELEPTERLTQKYSEDGIWTVLSLHWTDVQRKENGTYQCKAFNEQEEKKTEVNLLVQVPPEIEVGTVFGVSVTKIFLNWTVFTGHSPITGYTLATMKDGNETGWIYSAQQINPSVTEAVIDAEPGMGYKFRLVARNALGSSKEATSTEFVYPLADDPLYQPGAIVTGSTSESVSISWNAPPESVKRFIGYFEVWQAKAKNTHEHAISMTYPEDGNLYMFGKLRPATLYKFKVRACHRYIEKECGSWSELVEGSTMDGQSGPPTKLRVSCTENLETNIRSIQVDWEPPSEPNGKIVHYLARLHGSAKYLNEHNQPVEEDMGNNLKFIDGSVSTCNFDNLMPNTRYTVQVLGVTSAKRSGEAASAQCVMPPSGPDRSVLNRIHWSPYFDNDHWMFKLRMPRFLQRNGVICCVRIIVIKMAPHVGVQLLPPIQELLTSSRERSKDSPVSELYYAEELSLIAWGPSLADIILGDEERVPGSSPCDKCPLDEESAASDKSEIAPETEVSNLSRKRRGLPVDRRLDPAANYTAVVEIVVEDDTSPDKLRRFYSQYLNPSTPRVTMATPVHHDDSFPLIVALYVLCGLAFVLICLVAVLLALRRYAKRVAESEGLEMSLGATCRYWLRQFRDGRELLVSSQNSNFEPIPRDQMVTAYLERHQNNDNGFQHEFEMLPERFPDRTTRFTDARENAHKNRYPDIKCFDQTRVKLALQDNLPGTDYINANFVMSYKERKKFICAQGPMESTVVDFWRMIWEQRVEIIVMLTNLEEYNKTKCHQYWPDPDPDPKMSSVEPVYVDPVSETAPSTPSTILNGSADNSLPRHCSQTPTPTPNQTLERMHLPSGRKMYGDIQVLHVKETRYSEFIVRELQVSRPKNTTSSPTRNGKDTPDEENGILEREVRPVFQYHFIVWKDFQAPEYPSSLLKFLRRIQEDYSTDRGPILVHCSAGVGRTGTLVAIDCMLDQLEEENVAAVFNTVCDLRHQRNFLVQSMKQYVFVYRALMEWVQFGNTERKASELPALWKSMTQSTQSLQNFSLEQEYEKLSQVVEDRKALTVGSGEENRGKNRHDNVVPYDRNRVILTPVPGREHSTYINASFVEGYDNTESFIVTQDPLESTACDFWKMIMDQHVAAIVMLSECGNETYRCPQYWPGDGLTISFEQMVIKHVSSKPIGPYISRTFLLRNDKTGEEIDVCHLQFLGWPSTEDEERVPSGKEVAGLVKLAIEALALQAQHPEQATICVHCSTGSLRCSVLVGLCILIEQARLEGRVDVFTTARKLRSQRHYMLQYPGYYGLLYEGLVYYVTNHAHSLPESP